LSRLRGAEVNRPERKPEESLRMVSGEGLYVATEETSMSADIIERPVIYWEDWETRYTPSILEVKNPMYWCAPPPPPDERITGVKGNILNPPTFVPVERLRTCVKASVTIAKLPTHLRPGRPSGIDIANCPKGGSHDFRRNGKAQERCFKCSRTVMKHLRKTA
jgi:hypothetical protein